jgi:sugar lactone lactonase YvrE
VWRVHPRNGEFELYAAIPPTGSFLNGLTFDDRGNLFVTDSFLGAIWKVSPDRVVELWITSELLIWRDDPFPPAFGANGIVYWDGTLYVAVTGAGEAYLPELRGRNYPVVKVPIRRDGRAGRPRVFLDDDVLLVPDGLAVDRFGNLYVVDFGGLAWGPGFPHTGPAKLVRVRPDGTEEAVASDGLENAASVAIRGRTAYVTNLYVTHVPNIVKIDLCAEHSDHRSDSDGGDH